MKPIILIFIFILSFFSLQAQTLNQKLADQLDTRMRGDTVPTYSIYIFPDFSIPVQGDTLKEETFLRIWNQFIVCPGDHVFARNLDSLKPRDTIERLFKELLPEGVAFSLGMKNREEARRDFIQHAIVYFLEPEAVLKPYFIYLGDSILERPDKRLYRGGNVSGKGREMLVIGGISYWFLKNGALYTGASMDTSGQVYYQSVQDFLNKVDTGYARWLNMRTQSNGVPPEFRQKIVNEIQSDSEETIWTLPEEKKRRLSVSGIRIYPFFPFAEEEF